MTQLHLLWPEITKLQRPQKGLDNAGIGHTQAGERYVLKLDPAVCLAEFVGSGLCGILGVPTYEAAVVRFKTRPVFGGRLESGLERPATDPEFVSAVGRVSNASVFSSVLALDLALGNCDRHWDNWLYQDRGGGALTARAIDFSRSWPTVAPPPSFASLRGENTHKAWLQWAPLGVKYDAAAFAAACATLSAVPADWLEHRFEGLPVEWMTGPDGPALCQWWRDNWPARVDSVQAFVDNGAWT